MENKLKHWTFYANETMIELSQSVKMPTYYMEEWGVFTRSKRFDDYERFLYGTNHAHPFYVA